ncbi:Lpg1974 family pore-forming outer membrane protein [Mesorhizobium sp.]|uniref:Lpg1974 family pore-forming outer membrane protein n=1 Tax=Mesorhizobium sp. TaxID=1871066 RepID=UPI003BAA1890
MAASAASVTSVGVVAARAEDAKVTDQSVIDSRVKIAFEGAFFPNNVHSADKLGNSDKLGMGDSKNQFSGSIALTKQISNDLDWRLAGAFHVGKDWSVGASETVPGGTLAASLSDGFSFQTVDFDIGKHVKVQTADIRFFGGLRLLHADQKGFDYSFSATPTDPADKGGTYDKIGTSEYWGVGPRVGAEAYYPLGETWGLTGGVSGSVMWGRRTDRLGATLTNNEGGRQSATFFSESSNETVANVDASAGLSWTPLKGATFTAGYKIEQWHNLLENSDHRNQTFDGPFLRLEVKM